MSKNVNNDVSKDPYIHESPFSIPLQLDYNVLTRNKSVSHTITFQLQVTPPEIGRKNPSKL